MKTLAMAMAASLLLCGAHAVQASCAGTAAAVRAECLQWGGHPRVCGAMYRDDIRECARFGPRHRLIRPVPVRRPVPPPRPMPPPRPAPPQRPVPLPAPNR